MLLNYNKSVGSHKISAMAGYTARKQESLGFRADADSLLNGEVWNIPEDMRMLRVGGDRNQSNDDWYDGESFISYLGRVNYNYADKYLASVTFRADASSKFSGKYRWGYFPSVGVAWVASEEDFFETIKDKINFLKIKTSWGKLGNDKVPSFLSYPTIDPKGQQIIYEGKTYYLPTVEYLVDETVHWEVVSGIDAGFESRMMDGRLLLDLGYFSKVTNDLLARVKPSVSVGAGYAVTNVGSIRNSGLEFILGWQDKKGKFSYNLNVNGATLKNEVVSLGDPNGYIVSGKYHRTQIGHSVGAIYGYVQEGIFQNQDEIDAAPTTSWVSKPGDISYKDLTGDGKITDADRDFIGATIPSFTYGISLGMGYGQFDFSMDFNGLAGTKIINTKKLPSFARFNYYTSDLNRWHGEGTSVVEPILDASRSHNHLPSTNLLENGDYFRIRSVQVGYEIPRSAISQWGVSKIRFFANAQNLLTFRENTGYTPEIGGSIMEANVDNGSTYPIPTTYTFGLSVNF
jgi:TonB-linked SusC/RagA family outer membrane protein